MKLCTFRAGRDRIGALSTRRPEQVIDLEAAFEQLKPFNKGPLAGVDTPGVGTPGVGTPSVGTPGVDTPSVGSPPPFLRSMLDYLQGGPQAQEAVAELLELADAQEGPHRLNLSQVRLLAPVPRPASMRDCMAFERHFRQALRGGARIKFPAVARVDAFLRRAVGISLIRVPPLFRQLPVYYKGNPASVVGPDAEVRWPSYSEYLDYELEVGLFIHKAGRDLSPTQALEHIGGYTIFNDFSARDAQIREMDLKLGPAKGKDFDTGNAMGPWLVTPDEVGEPGELVAIARVNGEVWTQSGTRDLQFPVGEILSYISQSETLQPGDFIGLGTVPDGCGLEHGRWLKPGDEIELEVSRLGTLRNRVVR